MRLQIEQQKILATIREFPAQGALTCMSALLLRVSCYREILLHTHCYLPLLRYHYLCEREFQLLWVSAVKLEENCHGTSTSM